MKPLPLMLSRKSSPNCVPVWWVGTRLSPEVLRTLRSCWQNARKIKKVRKGATESRKGLKATIMKRVSPWGRTNLQQPRHTVACVAAHGASEKVIIQKPVIFRTLTVVRDVMGTKRRRFSSLGALHSRLPVRRCRAGFQAPN